MKIILSKELHIMQNYTHGILYGKLITWTQYQDIIVLEISYNNTTTEICIYRHRIFNFEQIHGGNYILFDMLAREIFII